MGWRGNGISILAIYFSQVWHPSPFWSFVVVTYYYFKAGNSWKQSNTFLMCVDLFKATYHFWLSNKVPIFPLYTITEFVSTKNNITIVLKFSILLEIIYYYFIVNNNNNNNYYYFVNIPTTCSINSVHFPVNGHSLVIILKKNF